MDNYDEYKLPEVKPEVKIEPETENKENAKPNLKNSENSEISKSGKPKAKKKEWQMPYMEYIDRETFDKLGRHEKGRLKFEQLTGAVEQVIFRKKYIYFQ